MAARKDRLWLYAGLLGVIGIGVARAVTGARVHKGDRILIIGDSLAVGLAPHLAALAKELGATVHSLAKEGTTIDYWAKNPALATTLASFQPTLILVSLGTNDEYLQGDAVARQRPALSQLLAELDRWPRKTDYGLGPEHGIVWIGPPALPKPTNGVTALIRGEVRKLYPQVRYFASQELPIPQGGDRIHPTARGYAGWAGALWQWLS